MRVYSDARPSAEILIASDVPRWFWRDLRNEGVHRGSPSPFPLEEGWRVDRGPTRDRLLSFASTLDRLLAEEVSFLRGLGPDLVVTDIDPLPVAAAFELGIPSVGIANFTWDWIHSALFPDLSRITREVARLYGTGTFLRLPLGPDHSPFLRTIEVPLLAGGTGSDPKAARKLLPEGRLCLFALREAPFAEEMILPEGFSAFSSAPRALRKDMLNITPEEAAAKGVSFASMVAASDVVVSKAGYGIISQILAMGKPCVLFHGRDFPEEPYLLAGLDGRTATVLLGPGRLHELPGAVLAAVEDPPPPQAASGGADFIVDGGWLDPES